GAAERRRGALATSAPSPEAARSATSSKTRCPAGKAACYGEQAARGAAMQLTPERLERYHADGLVHFEGLFTTAEVAALKAEVARILTLDLDSHLKAPSGEFLGTTAMHRVSPLFARLLRDERLLGIAEQLLGPNLYCHQYKVILKEP